MSTRSIALGNKPPRRGGEEEIELYEETLTALERKFKHLHGNQTGGNFTHDLILLDRDEGRPRMGDFDMIVVPSDKAFRILEEEHLVSNYRASAWNAWKKILRNHLVQSARSEFVYDSAKQTIDGIAITYMGNIGNISVAVIDGLLVPGNLSSADRAALFKK